MQQLPIFPLNAHVFEQGKLSLRIFEPRYLTMVKNQVSKSPSFIMGMLSQNHDNILTIGCKVDIIDFSQLDGGLLGITVKGTQMVQVLSTHRQDDGLNIASYQDISFWPDNEIDPQTEQAIISQYNLIVSEHQQLEAWYKDCKFNVKSLLLRLLEWMPIAAEQKVMLLQQPKLSYAADVFNQILQQNDPFLPSKRKQR